MKKALLALLICPACLPEENTLQEIIKETSGEDILEGVLSCPQCGKVYRIENGVADLDPNRSDSPAASENKYETTPVVSSYLWSHYADLFNDANASEAYRQWADLMSSHEGLAVDTGTAVGRFTFEMSKKCDLAVGVDTSRSFIRTARELMTHRAMTVALKQEGHITADVALSLPAEWDSGRVEFIVADVLALPFRTGSAASLTSLNLIDKVQRPILHLREMNRVARKQGAQFLLSDPFSWSEEAAPETEWLGGRTSGPFAGRGIDNIMCLLQGDGTEISPPWYVASHGHVWWKIRTHANHFEQIRSCYVKAGR